MIAGRDAVIRGAVADENGVLPQLWQWADQGEKYLRDKFAGTDLEFNTIVDGKHIVLTVYRESKKSATIVELFKIREKAEYFVSELAVTKIIMVI